MLMSAATTMSAAMSTTATMSAAAAAVKARATVEGWRRAGGHGVRGAAVSRRGIMDDGGLEAARRARTAVRLLAEGRRIVLYAAAVVDGRPGIAGLPGNVRSAA